MLPMLSASRIVLAAHANRLEHDIHVARNAKTSTQTRGIELMRPEIVKHDGATIQKRLDVEKLPISPRLLEDALAHREAQEPRRVRLVRPHKILRVRRPVHARMVVLFRWRHVTHKISQIAIVARSQNFAKFLATT